MNPYEAERRTLLTPVLLLLLAERGGHGYELVRRLVDMGWPDAESAHVYRVLRGLETCGAVTSHWDASDHGPARRVYAVTHQGAMELALWFVRLGELHGILHVFLERYVQLTDATATATATGAGDNRPSAPPSTGRASTEPPSADPSSTGHMRRIRK